jgi:type IV secretion system protein VirB5
MLSADKTDKSVEKAALVNPYLAGRAEYDDRYGNLVVRERTWRYLAFLCLLVMSAAVLGLAHAAGENRFVPYVVEVDKLGTVVPVRPADQAAKVDSRIVRATLANWIVNTRSVYIDAAAEQRVIKDAYSIIDSTAPAFAQVNDYMAANQPFQRAQTQSVDVEVQTVLPLAGDTWRLEWVETVRPRDGTPARRVNMQAVITTEVNPPTDEVAILANPLGIFVKSVNWSPRL